MVFSFGMDNSTKFKLKKFIKHIENTVQTQYNLNHHIEFKKST